MGNRNAPTGFFRSPWGHLFLVNDDGVCSIPLSTISLLRFYKAKAREQRKKLRGCGEEDHRMLFRW
jgi:hypothetical protein